MANERGTLCFFAFSSSLRPHLGSSDDSRKGTPHSGHQRREGAWAAARKLRDKGDPASRSLGVQSAVSTAESARPGPCSAARTAPRPLVLCSRQRAPVPAALWPHRRVVPASLMAQRTGNRPPADDREDSSDAVSGGGGVLAPADPVPPDSPLRFLSSSATLPVTVHPCGAAGAPGLIQPWMATCPPCPPGSC